MIVNLTGVTSVQTLSVTLNGLTDQFLQTLPDTPIAMSVLVGDVNADSTVNSGDALVTRSRSGQDPDGTTFRSDVNVDGVINSGDTTIVRARSGSGLPAN